MKLVVKLWDSSSSADVIPVDRINCTVIDCSKSLVYQSFSTLAIYYQHQQLSPICSSH